MAAERKLSRFKRQDTIFIPFLPLRLTLLGRELLSQAKYSGQYLACDKGTKVSTAWAPKKLWPRDSASECSASNSESIQ